MLGKEANEVDLNRLRELIHRGQLGRPPESTSVVVSDRGKLAIVDDTEAQSNRALTRIDTETPFAGRYEDELSFIDRKFPPVTDLLVVDGVRGWLYDVTCELGMDYRFWTYYDNVDGYYKTLVLEPKIEEYWCDIHRGHIYVGTNRLCLDTRYNGGAPTLGGAFGRTVVWATGFSTAIDTGKFQFSL